MLSKPEPDVVLDTILNSGSAKLHGNARNLLPKATVY